MKQPTTEYSIAMQEAIQINHDFLISEGWEVITDKPLFNTYRHVKNADARCSIGLYGEFYICELHWCNKTPEQSFNAINPSLTKEDYHKIIDMLRIKL